MLSCAISLGMVFLVDTADPNKIVNPHHVARFGISSSGNALTAKIPGFTSFTYNLPPQWQGHAPDAVLNACAEEARSLTITSQ